MYKLLVILIIIYFLITQVKLLSLCNIKYDKKNDLFTKEPALIVCSHDYEQNDVFIVINEFIVSKKPVTIVLRNLFGHHLLFYYLKFTGVVNIEFLFVKEEGGTVKSIQDELMKDRFVVTFLTRDNNSHGVYYSLKDLDEEKKLFLCKITSDYLKEGEYSSRFEKLTYNYDKEYQIEYEKYLYALSDDQDSFMIHLLERLYL